MRFPELRSPEALIGLVEEIGFLPFFVNRVPGFSVEECCPRELWFAEGVDGPWEWKGPAARSGKCVYGKLFRGKAGFVSREWLPELANFRRDGYDFDARFDDGLASIKDRDVYNAVAAHGPILSVDLRELLDYRKGGNRGFDTVITRLQMQTYVTVADFVYPLDRHGRPYGWGIAQYTTPESQLGAEAVTASYGKPPEDSRQRILGQLKKILPDVDEGEMWRLMKA